MPTEPLIESMKDALRRGANLRLALLFGSSARGTARSDSDLDIGIIPDDPELSLAAETDLQLELELATGRRVDLVRLDLASTLLRGAAARDALLLHEARPGAFLDFKVRATVEYLDFLPLYDVVAERFRRSLLRPASAPR